MSDFVHARVVEYLARLRLGLVAARIDALLSEAAKEDVTYLDFLDGLLSDELASGSASASRCTSRSPTFRR